MFGIEFFIGKGEFVLRETGRERGKTNGILQKSNEEMLGQNHGCWKVSSKEKMNAVVLSNLVLLACVRFPENSLTMVMVTLNQIDSLHSAVLKDIKVNSSS